MTPLSLLHRDHTNLCPHLHEHDLPQRLGEDVRELLVNANVIDIDLALFNALTNVVVLDVDVFTAVVMNRVLA